MVKIIMHGCCGHMGQVISDLVEKDTNAEIVAGIDVTDKGNTSYPVFTDIHECKTEAWYQYSDEADSGCCEGSCNCRI